MKFAKQWRLSPWRLSPWRLSPVLLALGLAACGGGARPPVDVDPQIRGPVSGVGIEGRDIVAMADTMVRDILLQPDFGAAAVPPQVIIDSEYFRNDSAQRLDKNLIVDRLRVQLNRAARGRMLFVGRQYAGLVDAERQAKRAGDVGGGTLQQAGRRAGADYRLVGRVGSIDSRNVESGATQRYTQITFEMINLENGFLVWSNDYRIQRASQEDVIYR